MSGLPSVAWVTVQVAVVVGGGEIDALVEVAQGDEGLVVLRDVGGVVVLELIKSVAVGAGELV